MRFNHYLLTLGLLIILGCKGESELNNVGGIQATTTSTSTNSCIDKTIDVGDKGVGVTNPRGTFSDIATVPGTNNYATAYYDAGSATINISFWNGSSFTHEVIAGDHLTTYIRMVFLSTGVPLVFWTNGSTSIKMASRSSAFGATGSWTMGVIDSLATSSRAIEVSVNPLDEVGVVYLAGNTATTSAPRFIFCSSGCSTSTNYNAMAAAMNIEAAIAPTAAVIGQVQTGMAWCQSAAGGDYYPAVAYTATNVQTRYAVCSQSSLSACLLNTNWTKTIISATGNIASSLYIDPAVLNDTPKIATNTSGIRTYEGTVGCTSPGAWTAGTAVLATTTATDANAWIKLLKSKSTPASVSNERYHIIANNTTTSVRYYNTSSNAFNTFAAWNGFGTLQTGTNLLSAASLTAGGATILASSNELISTHYNALTPANLVVSIVRNINQGSNVATVDLQYPNSTGYIQLIGSVANSTTAARNISVDSTSDGRPGVAYIDASNGTQATAKLKYAFRDSLQKNSTWQMITVPHSGTGPMYPALKYDHLNRPWISYYDQNATVANSRFYLMMNESTDGTGVWKIYQFPTAGTAAAVALNATNDSALGMYYYNGISYPVMVAIENNTVKVVKASRFNPSLETWSTPIIIDTFTANSAANLVMNNDSHGNFILAWVDLTVISPFAGVEYSYSNGGLSWTSPKRVQSDPTTVQKVGQGISIKLNPVTGYPAITYYDRADNKVYYSTCANSPLNCSLASWTNTIIESDAGVNGVTTYIGAGAASTRDQLLSTALTFDPDGNASILYPTGNGAVIGGTGTGHLKRVDISSLGVQTSSIFKVGAVASGSITNVNMAVAGHNVDSIRTSNSELVSVFVGSGNNLQSRSCGVE